MPSLNVAEKLMMISYHTNEDIAIEEYLDFLKRSDLGRQYPRERIHERLARILRNRSVAVSARNEAGILVGICFGLTDFSYFLFLTDLGVDRNYAKQGIGKEMIRRAEEEAGGQDDISVITVSHDDAIGFYRKMGYSAGSELLWKPCRVWTNHVIK